MMPTLAHLPQRCIIPVVKTPKDYKAYKISPDDTNRLAIVFDPENSEGSVTVCVEIFEPGSEIPPHRHPFAVEIFFILKGEGAAFCDGKIVPLQAGDSILVPSNAQHTIVNIGSDRLYALCIIGANEQFAELIRGGTPVALDQEDLAVLHGICQL
jgi:mannose-6-phosphate isomerase-like protein (cupin superfamily)